MSRVEPKQDQQQRETQQRREQPRRTDRTPGKAEGDENTVDEALRHQDEQERED